MTKRQQRWPIWRIVLILVGAVALAIGLFIAAALVASGEPAPDATSPLAPDAGAGQSLSNFLMLLGAIAVGLALVCVGWLVVRYTQSIPAWKKRAKLPAHRRK